MKSYLIMMAVRLIEMRRILKVTGSIYLHCDPTASHYLKMLMDSVIGPAGFKNEIVWRRTGAHGRAKRWGPIHDTLLFYTRSGSYTWNRAYQSYDAEYIRKFYRYEDAHGRYRPVLLTGPGTRRGSSGLPWRDVDPTDTGRHWELPPDRALPKWVAKPPSYSELTCQERLDVLDDQGMILWPKKEGAAPNYKRYLSVAPGNAIQDVIWDIRPISSQAKERVGYPTQKPLALLDRIIAASSDEGNLVFDPFCGCATALVSADSLNRRWVGIDLSPLAAELVKARLQREKGLFHEIHHRTDIPRRTDQGHLPHYRTHKHTLFGRQEGKCNGCGYAFPFANFEVDHVEPRAHGGTDHLENLQLLCNACNRRKGTKSQAQFLAEMKADFGAAWGERG